MWMPSSVCLTILFLNIIYLLFYYQSVSKLQYKIYQKCIFMDKFWHLLILIFHVLTILLHLVRLLVASIQSISFISPHTLPLVSRSQSIHEPLSLLLMLPPHSLYSAYYLPHTQQYSHSNILTLSPDIIHLAFYKYQSISQSFWVLYFREHIPRYFRELFPCNSFQQNYW